MRTLTYLPASIHEHYLKHWHNFVGAIKFERGPIEDLPDEFRVLRFAPSADRRMWTYATQCMSQPDDDSRLEVHLFAADEHKDLIELLAVAAHYHRTCARLDLGHTVNFGRPWLPDSACDHGLISRPYLDGPGLEWLTVGGSKTRFQWLIPVTKREVNICPRTQLRGIGITISKGPI